MPQRFSRPPLSTTQPSLVTIWRRHSESNRGIGALQARALPLGYVALARRWCPRPDLNRYEPGSRDFKSLVSTNSTTWAAYTPASFSWEAAKQKQIKKSRNQTKNGKTKTMERETGIEPAAPTLARLCSTTELFPQKLSYPKVVRKRGLEPPCLAALDPKSSASASFATSACKSVII